MLNVSCLCNYLYSPNCIRVMDPIPPTSLMPAFIDVKATL